jgi:hypothetical protein
MDSREPEKSQAGRGKNLFLFAWSMSDEEPPWFAVSAAKAYMPRD